MKEDLNDTRDACECREFVRGSFGLSTSHLCQNSGFSYRGEPESRLVGCRTITKERRRGTVMSRN